ncbi:GMC family oxidoreductase [Streptomyces litmocidini]|uniref:GMC family oxidoreductase n=1 Tax=Streptomyces litmocidini TaxID=67318 RepID=UPI00340480FE
MPEPNPPHTALSWADQNSESDAVVPDGTTLLDVTGELASIPPPVPADKDPMATYYCKTLRSVADKTYDVVIVGGGAVGVAVLDRLLHNKGKRALSVLVLEKGGFLLPEHVQNLDPRYQRLMMDAVARPWLAKNSGAHSFDLAPQIPYLGGRAQFWSTWIPQPTEAQMPTWPDKVKKEIAGYWNSARQYLGAVLPSAMGPQFTKLQPVLVKRLKDGLDKTVFNPDIQATGYEVELACRDTTSTLGFRKFSPVPRLIAATQNHPVHVDIVTGCEVQEIRHKKDTTGEKLHRATELATTQGVLKLGKDTKLVLANGIVEPTGLLQRSFADVLPDFTGTNLGGHVASWFSARVPRDAWPESKEGDELQIGCLYLRGQVTVESNKRDFHIHLMVVSNPKPGSSEADLYRLIPDSFDQEFLKQLASKDHIGFMVHTLGEWRSQPQDQKGSRVYVDHDTTVLDFAPSKTDLAVRTQMDLAAQDLVKKVLAKDHASKIEYWRPSTDGKPGEWQKDIPGTRLKDALVHESGTLWMGEDPKNSVTDLDCRLHTVSNVYVGGAATFPTSGSWNPTLAAVALAQRMADTLLPPANGGGNG